MKLFSPTYEEAAAAGYKGAEEMANMWEFYIKYDYFSEHRPLDKAIVKGQSFKDWAEEHKKDLLAKMQ